MKLFFPFLCRSHPCHLSAEHHDARSPKRLFCVFNPAYATSRLSPEGHRQVQALREKCTPLRPQVILVSPLTRALQTALGGFEHCVGQVPFVSHEELRERLGKYPCDARRPKSVLVAEFGSRVDFAGVPTEADVLWHPTERETHEQLGVRTLAALDIIRKRPERVCKIIHHANAHFNTHGMYTYTQHTYPCTNAHASRT